MFNSSNSEACPPQADSKSDSGFRGRSYSDSSIDSYKEKSRVKIPKIIMQTWKDRHVPDKWSESPASI